jgi:DNA polymerase-3 subunit gamma/tau
MARSGRDPSQFARDLLAHLRFLLVTQTTGEVPTSFVVTATDSARLESQANSIGAATLVRTIDELADALTAVREGDDARMAVEIALLKAARPDLDPTTEGLLRRIERLEAHLTGGGRPSPPARDPAPKDEAEPPAAAEPEVAEPGSAEPEVAEPGSAEPEVEAEPESTGPEVEAESEVEAELGSAESEAAAEPGAYEAKADLDIDEVASVWPAVLQKLAETAPALAATFEGARPVALGEEGLQIGFPADRTFNKRKAESPERREAVAAAFESVTGRAVRPTYVLLDGEPVEADESTASEKAVVDEQELLERLKSEFDAEEVG